MGGRGGLSGFVNRTKSIYQITQSEIPNFTGNEKQIENAKKIINVAVENINSLIKDANDYIKGDPSSEVARAQLDGYTSFAKYFIEDLSRHRDAKKIIEMNNNDIFSIKFLRFASSPFVRKELNTKTGKRKKK